MTGVPGRGKGGGEREAVRKRRQTTRAQSAGRHGPDGDEWDGRARRTSSRWLSRALASTALSNGRARRQPPANGASQEEGPTDVPLVQAPSEHTDQLSRAQIKFVDAALNIHYVWQLSGPVWTRAVRIQQQMCFNLVSSVLPRPFRTSQ